MSKEDRKAAYDFAVEMVKRLREKLLDMEGVDTMSTDGVSISYANVSQKLMYWEKQAQRLKCGTFTQSINLKDRL